MELFREIPLVNDMVTSVDATLDDLYKHFDGKMLDMFYRFNAKPSDDEILDYIEFINKTTLDPYYYKDIIKFINEENIHKVLDLFTNGDIERELFPLIPYELASKVWDVDDLKNLWLINNKEWMVFNRNNRDVENLYYDQYKHTYYRINDEIFTPTHNSIVESYEYVKDMESAIKNESYFVAKYILENINKSVERTVYGPTYVFDHIYNDMINLILQDTNVNEIKADIIKLLLLNVEYIDMNNMLEKALSKNYELFKYLYDISSDYLEINGIPTDDMYIVIKNSEYRKLVKNRKNKSDIKETDLLQRAIESKPGDTVSRGDIINLVSGGAKLTLIDILHIMYKSGWYLDYDFRRFLVENCVVTEIEFFILKDLLKIDF